MLAKATKYAKEKHQGQYRKFRGEDYFHHPHRVAQIVFAMKDSHELDSLVAAALLHDVVEDTNTPLSEINEHFGELVASLVGELTSSKEEIDRLGKRQYIADKMCTMSDWALVIKLADRLDNVSDLAIASDKFRVKYTAETAYVLAQLTAVRNLSNTQQTLVDRIKGKLKEVAND